MRVSGSPSTWWEKFKKKRWMAVERRKSIMCWCVWNFTKTPRHPAQVRICTKIKLVKYLFYVVSAAMDAVLEIRLKFCNCISYAYFRFMFVDTNFFFVVRTFSPPSFILSFILPPSSLITLFVHFQYLFLSQSFCIAYVFILSLAQQYSAFSRRHSSLYLLRTHTNALTRTH